MKYVKSKAKYAIALAVSLMLMLNMLPTVSAAEDNLLEQAIRTVKSRINIPEGYSDFRSEYFENETGAAWYLTWSEKQTQNSYRSNAAINVRIDTKMRIIGYYNSSSGGYYSSRARIPAFPALSIKDAAALAKEFIQKVAPELIGELNIAAANISNSNLTDGNYWISIPRITNGIPYEANNVYLQIVSSDGGMVQSFDTNWDYSGNFEDKNGVIAMEKAEQSYEKAFPLKLQYRVDNNQAKPVYVPSAKPYQYIDAKTGEKITITSDNYYPYAYGLGSGAIAEGSAKDQAVNNVLTEQELANVEEVKNLMSIDEAKELLYSMKLAGIDKSFSDSVSVNYSQSSEGYRLYIYAGKKTKQDDLYPSQNVSAVFDAVTKELLSLSVYANQTEYNEPKPADEKKNMEVAEQFVKHYVNEYNKEIGKPVVNDNGFMYSMRDVSYTSVAFPQRANDVDFGYYGVNVTVNKAGYIQYFEKNLFKGEVLPVKDIISNVKAEDEFYKSHGIELAYVLDSSKTEAATSAKIMPVTSQTGFKKLVYRAKPGIIGIDAVNGKVIYDPYYGDSYSLTVTPKYNDIADSVFKKEIETLASYGILPPSDSFRPTDVITQSELFAILYNINGDNKYMFNSSMKMDDYMYYAYNELLVNKLLNSREIAKDKEMTREEVIKYLLIYGNAVGLAADYPSLFQVSYADKVNIDKANVGYMALAEALNIMPADDSGNIYPKQKVSRGEAVYMIYNFLNRAKK